MSDDGANREGLVAVLGAGPAGLSAAMSLERLGVRTRVFERAPFVGGLARTLSRDGFLYDIGGHRFFSQVPEVVQFVKELMGEELLEVDRVSRIFFLGRYFDYPLRAHNAFFGLGAQKAVQIVADYGLARARGLLKPKELLSFEDWVVHHFGDTLYQIFFRPYTEKVWGIPCTEIEAAWAAQRIKALSLRTAVKDAVGRSLPGRKNGAVDHQGPATLVERFWYPRHGYGRISERMQEEIEKSGGSVKLLAEVDTVHHDGQRITGVTLRHPRGQGEPWREEAARYVSTLPITELVRRMDPAPPQALLDAADALQFRALVTAHIALDRERVTNDTWTYFPGDDVPFGRMHEPPRWSAEMAPPGKTSVVLEYFCDVDDETWRADEQSIIERSMKTLHEVLGYVQPHELIHGFVLRSRNVYPVYRMGYGDKLGALERYLDGFENLEYIGRLGRFAYQNTDHVIEAGIKIAQNMQGLADHDLHRINASQTYLEEGRAHQLDEQRA